ncbi:hypothetical protein LTS16_023883 [Friedmanniomyces endolithicus]|nr:hypothetical protein LTS09_000401 [Friedmanniomyces endolithicus]KAK0777291.1 hypothetical protein LTR38_015221 [Friedmanniomyces endolithicus]KAK0930109.1 hypothetical protein LTR57_001277 [Friedmanniomyces endolithicus]KAK1024645.1 hypothetical protein LTS16_023883 [Friedmanniomyces endolithicus]
MASRFYAASGVAYTTPAAFFAPSRREPEQLHPALRQKAPSTRQKSTRDGSGLQPERRRTRTSGNKSTSSKATRLRSEDEAAPLSQRGGPSVVMSECCEQKPASKDAPSGTAKSTRIRRARSEPRQPHNNVSSKDGHPGGLARFVGEIRLGPSISPHSRLVVKQTPPAARTIFIQTEDTPNADALKFRPNHDILPDGFPSSFLEYLSPRSTLAPPHPSPLAAQLLNVDGVTSVFYGKDYITVTKDSSTPWAHVKPEVFSLISETVTSGQPIVNTVENKTGEDGQGSSSSEAEATYAPEDEEVVGMIQELLETRIRPAIQEDGGDIEFRGFHEGQVMLKLRGACRTCDSSTVTLKNGIESMLMHYIEEVKGVQQVMDQEEEVAMKEFAKFEEKLRAQKGADAAPSTVGKGTLDTAEA